MRNRNASQNVSDVLAEVFKKAASNGASNAPRRCSSGPSRRQQGCPLTEAKTLQDGVLYVKVQDSETAMHLGFQRQKFVNVYVASSALKT